MMEKMKLHSPNLTQENIARIRELFPGCVTEAQGEEGQLKLAVDFDQLRQELSESIVEGPQERYHLNWPGKREALLTANAPIAKTLRPCREESVDFDTTRNLFIEGDNLEALKLLQETYLGKVKMIYIDPPYNTGNDFIYDDDFAENAEEFLKRSNQKDEEGNRLVANTEANGRFHSDWLSMMYPRLKLARNLLIDDGVIFISIDDGEAASLKAVCDEIFGKSNFLANLIWEKAYAPRNNAPAFSNSHDHILCYAKSYQDGVVGRLPASKEQRGRYTNRDQDPRGDWKAGDMTVSLVSGQRGRTFQRTGKGANLYTVTSPSGKVFSPSPGRSWVYGEEKFKQLVADNRIWWGESGDSMPSLKRFWNEINGTQVCQTIWKYEEVGHNQEASKELKNLFGELASAAFSTPKPTRLIERMLSLASSQDSIILDFFSGSATTAHAVIQLNAKDGGNRKFVMVQLPELCDEHSEAFKAGYKTIAEISKDRIRRAGKKILEGECHESWNKDIGFRVLKVDSSNMADVYYTPDAIDQTQVDAFVDNIKPDRKPEDLLFQVLLDWGVYDGPALPIRKESIQGKTVFFVNQPPYDLIACFDARVNEELVKELAHFEPLRVVFRDNGFVSDAVKINVEQIFKQMSPGTEVKSI